MATNGMLRNNTVGGVGGVSVGGSLGTERNKEGFFVMPDVKQMSHFRPSTVSGLLAICTFIKCKIIQKANSFSGCVIH